MPSGGLLVSARYSWRRRRWAVVDAIVAQVFMCCVGGDRVKFIGSGWGRKRNGEVEGRLWRQRG